MFTSTTMSIAQQLTEQFKSFHQELIIFVESCSAPNWCKVTAAERWAVGVTAHHIGTMHYPVAQWVYLIATEQQLPEITMDVIDQLNAQHVQESVHYTQAEVAGFLRSEGSKALETVVDFSDLQWMRAAYLRLLDTQISAAQLFTRVLIDSAHEHLESMKTTIGA